MRVTFLLPSSALIFVLLAALNSCNSPVQYHNNPITLGQIIVADDFNNYFNNFVVLDKNVVADVFGNHDKSITPDELNNLENYFAEYSEAWCLCGLGRENWYSYFMTPEQAKFNFTYNRTIPYPDEHALRQSLDGASIRTPFVSIVVLQKRDHIMLTNFFRSPGPNVGTAKWQRIIVK